MKRTFRHTVLLLFSFTAAAEAQLPSVTVAPGSAERTFAYTNKQDAFYCGVVNGENESGFHGITKSKRKLFENYWILLGTHILDRRTATTVVTPAGFQRRYPEFNTTEDVFFADSLTLLGVTITTSYNGDVALIPAFSSSLRDGTIASGGSHLTVDAAARGSAALPGSVSVHGYTGFWEAADEEMTRKLKNAAPFFIPAWYRGTLTSGRFGFSVEFSAAGDRAGDREQEELDRLKRERETRIAGLLAGLDFACDDPMTAATFPWFAATADALVMRQGTAGVYAGLPWFDDYWGRDTFLSLPGMLLATGRFETAREIFRSFAALQNRKDADSSYGRVPNRAQPGDVIYNTADGTPLFVSELWRYVDYSGDSAFATEMYPAVERAAVGTMKYHTDAQGFLVHGNAETWMDAVGPDGPWSPRGNRAVEIQAYWIDQLRCSARLARMANRRERVEAWEALAERLAALVPGLMLSPDGVIVDHVRADGRQDGQIRPNVLLALRSGVADIFPEESVRRTLAGIFPQCVYPYGVASLGQSDPDFHPYHVHPQRYPKDAAYHNGTIWTWLSGPAITLLCANGLADSAWRLTNALERIAATQGCICSLPECTDALAKPGSSAPAWSGTFSQAWSIAEYLRTMYEDYLGVRPTTLNGKPRLRIDPRLPSRVGALQASIRVHGNRVRVAVRNAGGRYTIQVLHTEGKDTVVLHAAPGADAGDSTYRLAPGGTVEYSFRRVPSDREQRTAREIRFCAPVPPDAISSLRAPSHGELDGPTIAMKNPNARLIFTGTDKLNDDKGPTGDYSYPASPHFAPGILDIAGLTVTADESFVYFTVNMRELTQPGWHPEYGFQLTMLSIAIDQWHEKSLQSRYLRHNSRYTLPPRYSYDRMILIGGGIEVRDRDDNPIAVYVPTDPRFAFGNPKTGTISFAIPVLYLGKPERDWVFTIVAGAQDDHGGAGIGEFRDVLPDRTEWNGGGNRGGGANVYDVFHSE